MATVSIILPAHNVGAHLRRSLDAVLRERAASPHVVDVVLVDNNSTDDTVAVAAGFPAVRVLRQPKQGSYAARNLGIAASSGDLVLFLDPDCEPRPGWIDAAVTALADPAVEIALGRRHYGRSRALRLLERYEDEKIQWILHSGGTEQVYGYTNNMAVRRSLLDRFGTFQERQRGGDTMFVQRVAQALGKRCIRFSPDMAVDHLEVTTLAAYYGKRAIYGASNERLSHEVRFRPLTRLQRFAVVRDLVRHGRIAAWEVALLLVLLAPGAVAYERARRAAS